MVCLVRDGVAIDEAVLPLYLVQDDPCRLRVKPHGCRVTVRHLLSGLAESTLDMLGEFLPRNSREGVCDKGYDLGCDVGFRVGRVLRGAECGGLDLVESHVAVRSIRDRVPEIRPDELPSRNSAGGTSGFAFLDMYLSEGDHTVECGAQRLREIDYQVKPCGQSADG